MSELERGKGTGSLCPNERHLSEITNLGTERKIRELFMFMRAFWVNKGTYLSGPHSLILKRGWTLS